MPYIEIKTAQEISPETMRVVKQKLGKAIACIPGKSEAWLMVAFSRLCSVSFGGTDAPCAFVDVRILGEAQKESFAALSDIIGNLLEQELSIPAQRSYIHFQMGEFWGWNQTMF